MCTCIVAGDLAHCHWTDSLPRPIAGPRGDSAGHRDSPAAVHDGAATAWFEAGEKSHKTPEAEVSRACLRNSLPRPPRLTCKWPRGTKRASDTAYPPKKSPLGDIRARKGIRSAFPDIRSLVRRWRFSANSPLSCLKFTPPPAYFFYIPSNPSFQTSLRTARVD
jgi:hypothetical protein